MRSIWLGVLMALAIIPIAFGAAQDENNLEHDWRMEKGSGEIRFVSKNLAPPPYSTTEEPEATLSMEVVTPPHQAPPLSELVQSQITKLRKDLRIGAYGADQEGRKPVKGIASYQEEIDGQHVAFIQYTTTGIEGKPATYPLTVRHAILVKNNKIYFVHLAILFPGHQDEVKRDQMRLVKGIIKGSQSG